MTRIATERLLLRPVEPGDLLPIANHINNLAVAQNLTRVVHPYFPDDFSRWEQRDKRHAHVFGITRDGAIIGVIGLESDAVGIDAEIGYWLAEPFWKQGLMSEAAGAARDFGFGRAGYDRLVSGYRHGNEASRRILLGLGFRHTGHKWAWSFALKRRIRVARVELTRREWLRERVRK